MGKCSLDHLSLEITLKSGPWKVTSMEEVTPTFPRKVGDSSLAKTSSAHSASACSSRPRLFERGATQAGCLLLRSPQITMLPFSSDRSPSRILFQLVFVFQFTSTVATTRGSFFPHEHYYRHAFVITVWKRGCVQLSLWNMFNVKYRTATRKSSHRRYSVLDVP